MSMKMFALSIVLVLGAFYLLTHVEINMTKKDLRYESCNEISYGDFGPRLCGYNINVICRNRQLPASPEEVMVCNRYFSLVKIDK